MPDDNHATSGFAAVLKYLRDVLVYPPYYPVFFASSIFVLAGIIREGILNRLSPFSSILSPAFFGDTYARTLKQFIIPVVVGGAQNVMVMGQ